MTGTRLSTRSITAFRMRSFSSVVKVGLSAVVPLTMIAWALFSSKKLTCAFKASRLTLLFVKGVVSATPTPSNKCVILIRSF
ncbi:Uncharacterised protein [Staphylococcus aureus]|nr:Uncharacterised protein [Staphylococcus aureus]